MEAWSTQSLMSGGETVRTVRIVAIGFISVRNGIVAERWKIQPRDFSLVVGSDWWLRLQQAWPAFFPFFCSHPALEAWEWYSARALTDALSPANPWQLPPLPRMSGSARLTLRRPPRLAQRLQRRQVLHLLLRQFLQRQPRLKRRLS
jgi:hypothetical protein